MPKNKFFFNLMTYSQTVLPILESLYLHGSKICAEIETFQPDIVIGLAHSGWMPVVVARSLWSQTRPAPFPPSVRTNIGREKHEIYSARFGKNMPAFCCGECCDGSDRLGHYLAWVAEQSAWLETLQAQIEQAYSGVPARILVVDDLFGGLRSGFTVLALLDTLNPKCEAYVFVGHRDLTNDFVTTWLEEFLPHLAEDAREDSPEHGRYQNTWQRMLKPLITGTEDIAPDRLDWRAIGPESDAVKSLAGLLPEETVLSAPAWAAGMACAYASQRLRGEITDPVPVPTEEDHRFYPLSKLSLSDKDRLAARAWRLNGVTLRDILEIFGDTPEGREKGLNTVSTGYEWHQQGQGDEAVYFLILGLESWITLYDLYKKKEPEFYPPDVLDPCGFAEFSPGKDCASPPFPGQLWAGAFPEASDSAVIDQPYKDLLTAGIDTFISLAGPGEDHTQRPYRKELAQVSQELGKKVRVVSFSLPFRQSPAPADIARILRYIHRAVQAGRRVYLHAGHNQEGRAPLVLACWLIQQGVPLSQALEQVNDFWLKTLPYLIRLPLSEEQSRFIQDWAGQGKSNLNQVHP